LALTISTNTASISAERHLQHSRADLNTAMERLSSGKRINSVGDDSAGLAIRDKMTSSGIFRSYGSEHHQHYGCLTQPQ
jgi:flagellin